MSVGSVVNAADGRRTSALIGSRARWLVLASLTALCAYLLLATTANALSQRGHVFSSSFGAPGSGDGQLTQPGQVAVNETTGEVYVVDKGNSRIERFASNGTFISAWGFGVTDGAQEFEVCTSACKPGTGKGALNNPGAIAVDNSSGPSAGDVYVVMDSNLKGGALWKFNAAGGAPGEAKKPVVIKQEGEEAKWEGALDGVAVDATGNLWVYRSAEEPTEAYVEGFNGKEEEKLTKAQREEKEAKGEGRGEANEYREIQLEPTLESEALISRNESEGLFCPKTGFGVDATAEHFFIDHERTNSVEECPEQVIAEEKEADKKATPIEKLRRVTPAKFGFVVSEEFPMLQGEIGSLNSQYTKAVAVDQASDPSTPLGGVARGDAYFAGESGITSVDPSGEVIQRITLPGAAPVASGVAINAKTGDVYATDAATGQVDVLAPAPAAGPSVDSFFGCTLSVMREVCTQNLTPTSTRVSARIDPGGADTEAWVVYGEEGCVTVPSECKEAPAPRVDLGSGFGDQPLEVTLNGLKPNTTYYYRVVAKSALGTAESQQSAQTFFTTLPSAKGVLADNRQWEMVTPPTKGGTLEAPTKEFAAAIQANEDGSGFAFGTAFSGPIGEAQGNRSLTVTPFLFTRGASEWTTQDLATPHNRGEGFKAGSQLPEYRLFSDDLALSIVEPESQFSFPLEDPPLSPPLSEAEAGHQEKTIYVRANSPVTPSAAERALYEAAAANRGYLDPGYLALITQLNDTAGIPFGAALEAEGEGFIDATRDLNHVVVSSPVALTTSGAAGLYQWNSDDPSHSLSLVSVLPGGAPALAPRLGGHAISRNAISEDGSQVVFTAADPTAENEAARLYLRDVATNETININAVQGSHSEPTPVDEENEERYRVTYQTASRNGSRIFFTDTWPLTDDSKLAPTSTSPPTDLYEYDVNTKKLVDLTVDQHNGESADVLGAIAGAGDNGANVYFVANGALTSDAQPGNCPDAPTATPPAGAACNLYVSALDSQSGLRKTTLIARLSAEDAPDWAQGVNTAESGAKEAGDLIYDTTRVSPNGRYLAFMSQRSLTGYDNEDVTSSAPGERLDEEVFVYDASAARLTCASCNPSGERPEGVRDVADSGEGQGLLVDRSLVWENRWLAGSLPGWTPAGVTHAIYQSRYLSDSGRLFFNSADALVTDDQNLKEDVYEYEPPAIGNCESANASGCIDLISSGSKVDEHESAFLDASARGDDAYFLTTERLLSQDYDTAFDIYDAHVCGTSESPACLPPVSPPPPPCSSEETCRPAFSGSAGFAGSATASFSGPGNIPGAGVLPNKAKAAPKKLTRAQKLARALKACKKQKKKKHRIACEKQARAKYGARKAKKHKANKHKAKKASGAVRRAAVR